MYDHNLTGKTLFEIPRDDQGRLWLTTYDPGYRELLDWVRSNDLLDATRDNEYVSQGSSHRDEAQEVKNLIRKLCQSATITKSRLLVDVFMAWSDYVSQWKYYVNTLTGAVERKRGKNSAGPKERPQELSLTELYREEFRHFCQALGAQPCDEKDFRDDFYSSLKHHKLNPWHHYLMGLPLVTAEDFEAKHGFDPLRACEHITGDSRDFQQRLWNLQMVGLVKRGYEPGCQHDHMMILFSPEKGMQKTSLLRNLVPDPRLYGQLQRVSTDKATYELVRGKVVVNIDECDGAFKGASGEVLKAFVTQQTDLYRPAYAAEAINQARTFALFGTTNSQAMIQDQAGDRRFFIVHVQKPIQIADEDGQKGFLSFREDLLAFYRQLYLSGYQTWLSKAEQVELERTQREYKVREPWMEVVEAIVGQLEEGYGAFRVSDIARVVRTELPDSKRWTNEALKDFLVHELRWSYGNPVIAKDRKQSSTKLFYKAEAHFIANYDMLAKILMNHLKGCYDPDGATELQPVA